MAAEQPDPPSLEQVSKDLDALKRSRETRGEEEAKLTPSGDSAKGAVNFLTATAVMSLLGFAVDHFAHTLPWGILIGLLLGVAIGAKLMLDNVAGSK
ncbi:MAG: AtpZ/AtpI family protein [Alphaproteobacteria bacterium]